MGSDFGFFVCFRIQVKTPRKGFWFLFVPIEVGLSSFIDNSSIENIAFRIAREDSPPGIPVLLNFNEIDDGMVDIFLIGYQETVTHRYRSNEQYFKFDVTWSQTTKSPESFSASTNSTVQDSWIVLRVEPNFEVQHWEEYVAFSYGDWLTGMGGLFSLVTTGFLWTSYGIAQCCGDGISMGILPGLSFNFFSYEELMWIKNRLGKSGVL